MPIPRAELFDLDETTSGQGIRNSNEWQAEAFRRAFCNGKDAPFDRVVARLQNGFSVLIRLPGNCMRAAAEHVTRFSVLSKTNGYEWREFGLPREGDQGQAVLNDITELWAKPGTELFSAIFRWRGSSEARKPHAIFHNLDFLWDAQGQLASGSAALTACFTLMETTRSGVVLALADREASPTIPPQLHRAFPEQVALTAIDFQAFESLIPVGLAEKLSPDHQTNPENWHLPETAAWLIASRLRWTDPIRAVMIMDNVARNLSANEPAAALSKAMARIWEATRSLEFRDPEPPPTGEVEGFQPKTTASIVEKIVVPYVNWGRFQVPAGEVDARTLLTQVMNLLPSGLILHGPPGTGKTHLLRWVAGKIGLPWREVPAAEILATGWGDAERNVRKLFQEARRVAPCLLILDDCDALLRERKMAEGSLAGAERSLVLTFLQELEGFDGRPSGVLVALTTNQFDELDRAVRSRIGLGNCWRVPYPTTLEQVRRIVQAVARKLGLKIAGFEDQLVEIFFRPTSDDVNWKTDDEGERERASAGLFSPREIQHAMRTLFPADGEFPADGNCQIKQDDLERMKRGLNPSRYTEGAA